ncbi:MAG: malto-oligosyltrehalose synthase, partial [Methylotenera sp.]|nr:malto-oligosyltrehalose synthase [Methylotenera sp.]
VPNHMGVGGYENPWWQHVFEWGQTSPYAFWFDIDWYSTDPELYNKILAPFLGEPYGEVLQKDDITLSFNQQDGCLEAKYYSHHFPIALKDYAAILARADSPELARLISALGEINFAQKFSSVEGQVEDVRKALKNFGADEKGLKTIEIALQYYTAGTPESRNALHELLEHQHYRLTWWRNAADEINWRRFFEVCELAGVRVELDEVFEATHSLIFELFAKGLIDGVRLDHIDGLAHPQQYCLKLWTRLDALVEKRPKHLHNNPYIIAEKILERHEWLHKEWHIHGTTGYEFMDQVSALLHDPRGAEPLGVLWKELAKDPFDFLQHVHNARRQLLSENLVGEFSATATSLHRIARADLRSRDYSLAAIKRVLIEILVHFPVYRTYIGRCGPDETDKAVLQTTANRAKLTLSNVDRPLMDIVLSWLSAELVIQQPDSEMSDLSQRAITRFQQLTPPLVAKSVEDTAFYRYGRLLSRNEVGSDPSKMSLDVAEFHKICTSRQNIFPQTMLATATHDHKRGEDVRTRIAVISQIPQRWLELVTEWQQTNARFHIDLVQEENPNATYNVPRPHHEVMLYQMLIGAWPYELAVDDIAGMKTYAERLNGWLLKSIREAKRISNWIQANELYEKGCSDFLFNMMDIEKSAAFLYSAASFVEEISASGAVNSLSQTLLRMTTPGVPDLYQGTELWDFTLVDPDNRRAVDYETRRNMLNEEVDLTSKIIHWKTGAIKQHIIATTLLFRKKHFSLFNEGNYIPLKITGPRAIHLVAFMRSYQNQTGIVVVPRLTHAFTEGGKGLAFTPGHWENTFVQLPTLTNGEIHDVLTGQRYHVYSGKIDVARIFSQLPIVLLCVSDQA